MDEVSINSAEMSSEFMLGANIYPTRRIGGWAGAAEEVLFDETCRGKGLVSPIFRKRFECSRSGFHCDKFFQLRHPDALGFEIGLEVTRRHGCDVHADSAFFLGETATMDF